MQPTDITELFAPAALWGAALLFRRMGAAEFGPVALSGVRMVGATLLLLPLPAWRGQLGALRAHWRPILIVGITNSAVRFLCLAYAALSLTAGRSSICHASSPLFGAVIAWQWLRDRLTPARVHGSQIGFAGVLWLAWGTADFKPGGTCWALLACLVGLL